MTKRITITMTHPRSGWTRLAGTVLPICETASTEAAMSEFDALQCIAAGPPIAPRVICWSPPPN